MTESVFEEIDDVLPPEPNGELVQWMEERPLTLGTTGVAVAAVGAFALGALVTVAVLGLMHWVGPEREPPRARWGRRRT